MASPTSHGKAIPSGGPVRLPGTVPASKAGHQDAQSERNRTGAGGLSQDVDVSVTEELSARFPSPQSSPRTSMAMSDSLDPANPMAQGKAATDASSTPVLAGTGTRHHVAPQMLDESSGSPAMAVASPSSPILFPSPLLSSPAPPEAACAQVGHDAVRAVQEALANRQRRTRKPVFVPAEMVSSPQLNSPQPTSPQLTPPHLTSRFTFLTSRSTLHLAPSTLQGATSGLAGDASLRASEHALGGADGFARRLIKGAENGAHVRLDTGLHCFDKTLRLRVRSSDKGARLADAAHAAGGPGAPRPRLVPFVVGAEEGPYVDAGGGGGRVLNVEGRAHGGGEIGRSGTAGGGQQASRQSAVSCVEGRWVMESGVCGSVTGAYLTSQGLHGSESDVDRGEVLLAVRGGPWALLSVSLRVCGGLVVGLAGQGNASMVVCDVGGVSLRLPAAAGVAAAGNSVFVAEKCSFRFIGLDTNKELWRESFPGEFLSWPLLGARQSQHPHGVGEQEVEAPLAGEEGALGDGRFEADEVSGVEDTHLEGGGG